MGFTAVNLKNYEYDQSGFENEEEAHSYIQALVCDVCLKDLKRGFYEMEVDNKIVREPVPNVLHTSCGEPWLIIPDEEYTNITCIADLFIAAGMQPSDEVLEKLTPEQLERLKRRQEELRKKKKKR